MTGGWTCPVRRPRNWSCNWPRGGGDGFSRRFVDDSDDLAKLLERLNEVKSADPYTLRVRKLDREN
jgi:hypothetical protein